MVGEIFELSPINRKGGSMSPNIVHLQPGAERKKLAMASSCSDDGRLDIFPTLVGILIQTMRLLCPPTAERERERWTPV